MVKKAGFMKRCLAQTLAAAAAGSKADRTVKAEQIVVRDFKRSAGMFEFLISNAVGQHDRFGVFDLNQNVPSSRKSLVKSDDFNARDQSSRVEAWLRFENAFRMRRP